LANTLLAHNNTKIKECQYQAKGYIKQNTNYFAHLIIESVNYVRGLEQSIFYPTEPRPKTKISANFSHSPCREQPLSLIYIPPKQSA
jgi:hypothetical protein